MNAAPHPAGSPVASAAPAAERSARAAWRRPLPHFAGDPVTRWATRSVVALYGRRVEEITGLEHLAPERGPFILALNHSTRPEAVLVPTCLMFHLGGRRLHFLADWNSLLIPGVGFLMRRGGVIVVMRKPARPAFLNVLRPLFVPRVPAFARAREILAAGGAVGLFPEGTANRDPARLLRGYDGAARLSLETGAPVVPAGIRYPEHKGLLPISDSEKMRVVIGEPIAPGEVFPAGAAPLGAVRGWHARIMTEIAGLCGKRWEPGSPRHKYVA